MSCQICVKLVHSWGLTPQVIPVKSPSRKDFQEGVKRTFSHFHVVAMGSGCALVQLQPLTGGSETLPALTTVFGWGVGRGSGKKVVVVVMAAWGAFDGL